MTATLLGPGGEIDAHVFGSPDSGASWLELLTDGLGRLRVLVDGLTVTADTINLDTTDLEAALASILAVLQGTLDVDVSDDAGRVLGHVVVDSMPAISLGEIEVKNDAGNPLPVNGTVAVSNAFALESTLQSVLTELGQKLEQGQEVALDAATLAALESITVTVANFPASVAVTGPLTDAQLRATPVPVSGTLALSGSVEVSNDAGNPLPVSGTVAVSNAFGLEATLQSILTELAQKVEEGGTVSLSVASLAALESITVAGTVALDAPTLAALENITAAITGTVALDAPTLAALESITATISGSVAVTGPLTDTQLRATPVPVSGTLALSGSVEVSNDVDNPLPVSLPALPGAEFAQVAVGTSQVAVPTVALAGRSTVSIKALIANGAEVYIGKTGVTTLTGYELSAGQSIDIDLDDTVALFAISASGTQRVCVAEVA